MRRKLHHIGFKLSSVFLCRDCKKPRRGECSIFSSKSPCPRFLLHGSAVLAVCHVLYVHTGMVYDFWRMFKERMSTLNGL